MSVVLVEASPQALGLCLGQIVLPKVGETPLRTTQCDVLFKLSARMIFLETLIVNIP